MLPLARNRIAKTPVCEFLALPVSDLASTRDGRCVETTPAHKGLAVRCLVLNGFWIKGLPPL